MIPEDIILDEELSAVWGSADFGEHICKRDVVRFALLKYACGYETGRTAKCILSELHLLKWNPGEKETISDRGREYLFAAFSNGKEKSF